MKQHMLFLFNTATRRTEPFTPLDGNNVRIYSCGPTVYSTATIGNLRSALLADLLKRTLRFLGYEVLHIMNITDVGHLTHNEEALGQDKIEMAANRENKSAREIADFYTAQFMNDIERLHIIPAESYPRATEYIDAQIELIKILESKGFTYATSDGIYFDTAQFPDYGKLSGQKNEEKEEGARVEKNIEKRNASDFALWKFSATDSKRQMEWSSPWGVGFPGWHIECSAMSRALLGQPFDIHTGGIDLISPHHENEIAQSVVAFGQPLARYWLHGEFIMIDGGKMAKSLGNIYTMDDIVKQGFNPLAYRYLILTAHYRSKLNFTFEALQGAQNAFNNIRDEVRTWNASSRISTEFIARFRDIIEDDLDMPGVLALTWELIKSDLDSAIKSATLLKFDEVLGLHLDQWIAQPLLIPPSIEALAQQRHAARMTKDFSAADSFRDQIHEAGYVVEDTSEGYLIKEK